MRSFAHQQVSPGCLALAAQIHSDSSEVCNTDHCPEARYWTRWTIGVSQDHIFQVNFHCKILFLSLLLIPSVCITNCSACWCNDTGVW